MSRDVSTLRAALILFAAFATATLLARAIWSRLSAELFVRTDIVGYPTIANFNIERYYQRYWLVVVFVPVVTLGLFLALDRVMPGRPTRHGSLGPSSRAHGTSSTSRGWDIVGRVGLVGAILAVEIAMATQREPDWIWSIGLPTTLLYGAGVAAAGRWLEMLAGRDAWERAAAANAWASPPLLFVGLYAAAEGTKVVGPEREWSYHWLPPWLSGALALAAIAWVVVQMRRGDAPPVIDRRVALAISGPVAVFLGTTLLPSALGPMDMFHEGERLGAAQLVRDGAFPWRDLIFIHGLLEDVLSPLLGMTIFEDSRWGAAAGGSVLLVPLYWIAIYAFCAFVFRSNWLFLVASQFAVFASVRGVGQSKFDFLFGTELRFLLLPLALIALIGLLRHASRPRAALFAGITLLQSILSPEAAIASVFFFFAVVAYEAMGFHRGRPLGENFRRTGLTIAFGVVLFAIWCAFLAWHGAFDDFFSVYLTFSSSHQLTGGIPVQPSGTYYWLAVYVPPTAALVMLGLITTRLFRRQGVTAEDWSLGAMALFVLAYFHKLLTRPDTAHVLQVAAVSLPLVLYVAFRTVDAIDHVLTKIELPQWDVGIPRRATLAILVLVVAMNGQTIDATLDSLPQRLEASTGSAPELSAVGFANTDAVDETIVRDLGEIARSYLEPGDKIFDFSNAPALFHYILHLRPATRYYHVSLAIRRKTQLDLVHELEQNKPKLVFFPGPNAGLTALTSWDGVSNPIRHYEISEWILRRYRPIAASHGFVVMVPKSAPPPPIAALRRRLAESPKTDRLYFRSPPCNWGYAPNFLSTEPDSKSTPLTFDLSRTPFRIQGWAVDLQKREPAMRVVVAQGEQIVASALPRIVRPDVEKSLSNERFERSGFQVSFPWSRIVRATGKRDLSNVRVYGLLEDGRAVELGYGAFSGWRPTTPLPSQLTFEGRRIPVANEAPAGAVDESSAREIAVRVPSFAPYSWLELESTGPLPANDFMISPQEDSTDPLTFSTLSRGERRIRVRVDACSQWFGYRGKNLLIRSRLAPNIAAVRLYR